MDELLTGQENLQLMADLKQAPGLGVSPTVSREPWIALMCPKIRGSRINGGWDAETAGPHETPDPS